jgi:hypothetical protein
MHAPAAAACHPALRAPRSLPRDTAFAAHARHRIKMLRDGRVYAAQGCMCAGTDDMDTMAAICLLRARVYDMQQVAQQVSRAPHLSLAPCRCSLRVQGG